VSGEGVTASLLRSRGIRVFSEEEFEAADAAIREIERQRQLPTTQLATTQLPTTQLPTTQDDGS